MRIETPIDTIIDVKGNAILLGASPEELGVVAEWLFCLKYGNEGEHRHCVLLLRELRVNPQKRLAPEMTHSISLVSLREPFNHLPMFQMQDLIMAMDRTLVAFQFEVSGSDLALRQTLKALAEDITSGVLPVEDIDDEAGQDVWQEYVDFYTEKYSKTTKS